MIREILPKDEADLLRLSRQAMPGWIRLAYCNSPSFAAGEAVKGDEVATVVWMEKNERLGGCATRAVKRLWVDGKCRRVGYLAGLRSFEFTRNKFGLFRGYEWMRERERLDPLSLYLSTIVSANHAVRKLLTNRRSGIPAYLEAGEIVTFGMTARAIKRRCRVAEDFTVSDGETVGKMRLRAFYNEVSPRGSFFPVLPETLPAGLTWRDFVVLEKDGEIVAAAALWNQQAIRQIHVASYHPALAMLRPAVNPVLRCLGYFPLPCAGSDLNCMYWAYRLTHNESAREFDSLLAASAARLAGSDDDFFPHRATESQRNTEDKILFFALHERDALLPRAMRLNAWRYRSMLYEVSFAKEPEPFVFHQPPYIELATL